MTQQERLLVILRRFYTAMSRETGPVYADLCAVLDEAQNGPPDGAADGSISERLWMAANQLRAAHHIMGEKMMAVGALLGAGARTPPPTLDLEDTPPPLPSYVPLPMTVQDLEEVIAESGVAAAIVEAVKRGVQ